MNASEIFYITASVFLILFLFAGIVVFYKVYTLLNSLKKATESFTEKANEFSIIKTKMKISVLKKLLSIFKGGE